MKLGLIPLGATALAAMAALAGCSRPAATRAPAQPPAQSDYSAPPDITAVLAQRSGAVLLTGTALPQSRVRLASANGAASGATTSAKGVWSLLIGSAQAPQLFSLSQDQAGRLVRARGYLAVLPGPGAAMLRPTAGARPLLAPGAAPRIGAVDFDAAGAGVVSGRAGADRPVRVLLDGRDAGEGRSDARGWFDVSLPDNLKAGPHTVTVTTPDGKAQRQFDGSRAGPIATPPLNAARSGDAWRLDWLSPGGGVQSTVLFDQPASSAGTAR